MLAALPLCRPTPAPRFPGSRFPGPRFPGSQVPRFPGSQVPRSQVPRPQVPGSQVPRPPARGGPTIYGTAITPPRCSSLTWRASRFAYSRATPCGWPATAGPTRRWPGRQRGRRQHTLTDDFQFDSCQFGSVFVANGMLAVGNLKLAFDAAQFGREVAQAVIVDGGNDHTDVGIAAGHFEGCGHIAAGRDAAEDALLAGKTARHLQSLVGCGGDNAIQVFDVQHFGDEAVADAFDLVRAPRAAGEDIAFGWLNGKDFDIGVPLFEIFRAAGDSAAGSLREDERADLAFRLLPDFRAGGAVMSLNIVGVDELANLPVFAGRGGFQFFDLLDHQINIALRAGGQHQFGPVGANGLFALLAHPLRHDDDDGIALCRADTGRGNAGIAGSAFNDGHAGPQVAAPLGLRDQEGQNTVFDAATGVKILDFSDNFGFDIAEDTVQPHHRRHSSRVQNAINNTRASIPVDHKKNLHFVGMQLMIWTSVGAHLWCAPPIYRPVSPILPVLSINRQCAP